MLDPRFQPSLESLLQRMSEDISAKAVLLLHENGQVISSHGWIGEHEYPAMAALVAAMIATGKSLGGLGESFMEAPSRFSCDSDDVGLYMVSVSPDIWLAALYEQPLSPGQVRMKIRRYAATCAHLGTERPSQWEQDQWESNEPAEPVSQPRATLPPDTTLPEKITLNDSSLFTNITDDEIDRLFENTDS